MHDTLDEVKADWARYKLAFSDFSKEDAITLLKAIVIKKIDGDWGAGFVRLAQLELLTKAFPEDGLLREMYRQLHEKCNRIMVEARTEEDARFAYENCLRDEPCTYDHHGEGYKTWFDANDDRLLKALARKYPKDVKGIEGVMYWL